MAPDSSSTSTSTVGLPRESRISRHGYRRSRSSVSLSSDSNSSEPAGSCLARLSNSISVAMNVGHLGQGYHVGPVAGRLVRDLDGFRRRRPRPRRRPRRAPAPARIRAGRRSWSPCPPGCCTEWVASNTTGQPVWAMIGRRAHVGRPGCCSRSWRRARHSRMRSIAGALDLLRHVGHVPGRQELPFLDVDRAPGLAGRQQQIGLAAEEGRDLQHIDRLGQRRRIARADARRSAPGSRSVSRISAKTGRLASSPMPRCARDAGAVRLVERGLVDQPDAAPCRRSPSAPRRISQRMRRGFPAGRARRSAPAADRCRCVRRADTERDDGVDIAIDLRPAATARRPPR